VRVIAVTSRARGTEEAPLGQLDLGLEADVRRPNAAVELRPRERQAQRVGVPLPVERPARLEMAEHRLGSSQ